MGSFGVHQGLLGFAASACVHCCFLYYKAGIFRKVNLFMLVKRKFMTKGWGRRREVGFPRLGLQPMGGAGRPCCPMGKFSDQCPHSPGTRTAPRHPDVPGPREFAPSPCWILAGDQVSAQALLPIPVPCVADAQRVLCLQPSLPKGSYMPVPAVSPNSDYLRCH